MKEPLLPILGILGNALLITAYVPQITKTFKAKKADDLSLGMWVLWFFGDLCFLLYSVLEKDLYSSILFGCFTFGNVLILSLILRYGKTSKKS